MLKVRVLHRPLRELRLLLSAMLSFCLISAITGLFIRIAVHGSAVFLPNKLGIWTAKCQSKCRGVSVMIQNKSWNIMCASANVSKLRVVASFLYVSVDKDYDSVKNESVPNSSEIQYSMLETLWLVFQTISLLSLITRVTCCLLPNFCVCIRLDSSIV